jgi:hypothetical protein
MAANEIQKHQIPRLKVIERQRRGLANYNYNYNNSNNIRSGGSSFSSVCEKERAIEALNNIFNTFNSTASSTYV